MLGERPLARTNRDYLASLALCLAVALLIERGPAGIAAIDVDRLSLLHVVLVGLIGLFWTVVVALEQGGWAALRARLRKADALRTGAPEQLFLSMRARLIAAASGLALLTLGLLALFPEVRHGPLGEVDPLYARLRLQRIVEIQPLIPPAWLAAGEFGQAAQRALLLLGLGLFALPWLARRLFDGHRPERRAWRSDFLTRGNQVTPNPIGSTSSLRCAGSRQAKPRS